MLIELRAALSGARFPVPAIPATRWLPLPGGGCGSLSRQEPRVPAPASGVGFIWLGFFWGVASLYFPVTTSAPLPWLCLHLPPPLTPHSKRKKTPTPKSV